MKKKKFRIPVGLRTAKTALAVILAMIVVEPFGTSSSKLVFAMLGALAAVQPTFTESLESCMTQIFGVLFGALTGGLLLLLQLPELLAAGIGIILVISLYNGFHLRYSAGIACIIVVSVCLDGETRPFLYAFTRMWDTAIGLAIGMVINTLVFPYDNSRRISGLIRSLNSDILSFLEQVFDGDDVFPDPAGLNRELQDLERQLAIFSNQKLILRLSRQKAELERYQQCDEKAKELIARLQILSLAGRPGRLSDENRQRLKHAGAEIRDTRPLKNPQERDVVTNYHVRQILLRREELLELLQKGSE